MTLQYLFTCLDAIHSKRTEFLTRFFIFFNCTMHFISINMFRVSVYRKFWIFLFTVDWIVTNCFSDQFFVDLFFFGKKISANAANWKLCIYPYVGVSSALLISRKQKKLLLAHNYAAYRRLWTEIHFTGIAFETWLIKHERQKSRTISCKVITVSIYITLHSSIKRRERSQKVARISSRLIILHHFLAVPNT